MQLTIIIGTVENGETRLIQVHPDGDYDYEEKFAAIGSGSLFSEILLRKLYHPEITVEFGKRLVGYLIWEVQEIDNDSGEDMQIAIINKDGELNWVDRLEVEAFKQLPPIAAKSYASLKELVNSVDLEQLKKGVEQFDKTVETSAKGVQEWQ